MSPIPTFHLVDKISAAVRQRLLPSSCAPPSAAIGVLCRQAMKWRRKRKREKEEGKVSLNTIRLA